MDTNVKTAGLAPFSLKDAPALIERVFPAQKVGIESQKERKAGAGQTLTSLGSYWKGRKPLVLVRACVLASLLPATDDPDTDIEIFETLMRMDSDGLLRRSPKMTAELVARNLPVPYGGDHLSRSKARPGEEDDSEGEVVARWRPTDLSHIEDPAIRREERMRIEAERADLRRRAFLRMPFSQQVGICERVEKIEDLTGTDDPLYDGIWTRVNGYLGTSANSLPELIEELGLARFGRRPVVGDPFCGGGSIPFEAARVGCDVVASDLNPVAAMLTWGALNIIGANEDTRSRLAAEQRRIAVEVDAEIIRLGIEHNSRGDRAKAYLYCLETIDPQTGWLVPMAPSWVISRNRRCIAELTPNYARKCFDISIREDVSAEKLAAAKFGTVQNGYLVYKLALIEGGEATEWRISISRLRGDGGGPLQPDASIGNTLRQWEITDFQPSKPIWDQNAAVNNPACAIGAWIGGDVWQERLYCIQWARRNSVGGRHRPETRFMAPDREDLIREEEIAELVGINLASWQAQGHVPNMRIEAGSETTRLTRERGWTFWHHLFTPRHLHLMAQVRKLAKEPDVMLRLCSLLNRTSRLTQWHVGHGGRDGSAPSADQVDHVFYNMALNVAYNFAGRSWPSLVSFVTDETPHFHLSGNGTLNLGNVAGVHDQASLWIYDPPYADAVNYHEITEFFIAWLRTNPAAPFDTWTWDSRRPLAIQGKGEKFRTDMVAAFKAMADHMPDNGMQICMFTHKDAAVWADMAGIVWAAGLRVTAAWYVSTETSSELKQGGYVQGTVLLVLRKRNGEEHGYRSDIVPEVRSRVAAQVESLTGLNQRARGRGRDESLFSDADIQMAGYAAALEVLTDYTHIDGVDMTREALRPRPAVRRGQATPVGIVEEMIALAVQTANERMLPDGLAEVLWERLSAAERFYLKMTAAEAAWTSNVAGGKLDDYQNFAKAYRAQGWEDLMGDRQPNRARLKSATEFRSAYLSGHAISSGSLRPTLYAIMGLKRDAEADMAADESGKQVLHGLRDHFGDAEWLRERDNVRTLSTWLGRTWERRNPLEATAARVLSSLIASERL